MPAPYPDLGTCACPERGAKEGTAPRKPEHLVGHEDGAPRFAVRVGMALVRTMRTVSAPAKKISPRGRPIDPGSAAPASRSVRAPVRTFALDVPFAMRGVAAA